MKRMNTAMILAGGLVIALGLVAAGQVSLGTYVYSGSQPLVIGDYTDPFRYGGSDVRALEGTAMIGIDPSFDIGGVVADVQTTEESGPLKVSESRSLDGKIEIVMERFLGPESYMQGGIAENLLIHGDTGVMSSVMPEMLGVFVGWGLLDVYNNGELVYSDLPGHFMVTQRVRRGVDFGYEIYRASDNTVYSPSLVDKTGFTFSTDLELHLWATSELAGFDYQSNEKVFLNLDFLLVPTAQAIGGGGNTPSFGTQPDPVTDPGTDPEGNPNAGPKGNNGIGNGVDPQPPGDPKPNDQ